MKQSIQKLWRYAKPARAAFIVSSLIMSLRYFVINYLTAYLTGRITEAAQHMDVAGLLRDVAGFIACLIPFLFVDAVSKYAQDRQRPAPNRLFAHPACPALAGGNAGRKPQSDAVPAE